MLCGGDTIRLYNATIVTQYRDDASLRCHIVARRPPHLCEDVLEPVHQRNQALAEGGGPSRVRSGRHGCRCAQWRCVLCARACACCLVCPLQLTTQTAMSAAKWFPFAKSAPPAPAAAQHSADNSPPRSRVASRAEMPTAAELEEKLRKELSATEVVRATARAPLPLLSRGTLML